MNEKEFKAIVKGIKKVNDKFIFVTPTSLCVNGDSISCLAMVCATIEKLKETMPVDIIKESIEFALMSDKDQEKELKRALKENEDLSIKSDDRLQYLFNQLIGKGNK